jgi:hypothetical protein
MPKERIVDWQLSAEIEKVVPSTVHVTVRRAGNPRWDDECAGLGYDDFTYTVTPLKGANNWAMTDASHKLKDLQDRYCIVTTRH